MKSFEKFLIAQLFTLPFSSFSNAAEGYAGASTPSLADIDKVLSAQRTCMSDPKILQTSLENLTILTADVSDGSQEVGNFSVMLNNNHLKQLSYSTYLWEALVAGAEKLKELNWVVLPHQNGKVVTLKKWEEVHSKDKSNCFDQNRTCEDQVAKRISLAITSKAAGVIKAGNMTINCLRESDANLLQVLLDNKYTFNRKTKKWEKPKSSSNPDPEITKGFESPNN